MAYTYQNYGAGIINTSLTVNTPSPLDTRTVVDDLNNLYSLPKETAYQGMTVANINDGNIYMLIDKEKMNEKIGWKASYESIQILTCTQEEYDEWAANTTEDFKPIDDTKTYLRRDVYYYIFEDEEKSQYYVTAKQIDDWLKAKASKSEFDNLSTYTNTFKQEYLAKTEEIDRNIAGINTNINDNYSTSETIASIYATQESLQTTDDKFKNYLTSEEINNTYVTKESLRGNLGEEGGEDDFVFVTQNQYSTDNEDKLKEFTTETLVLKTEDSSVNITYDNKDIKVGDKPIAYREEVPKIELVLTKAEYDSKEDIDPETYYYIQDDETIGYLTNQSANDLYYSKTQVNSLIAQEIQKLIDDYITPMRQELDALKGSEV